MAAAAISEGAPPSSWQKGDTPRIAMHQNRQHPHKGAAVSNCAHLLSPVVFFKEFEELKTYLPAAHCSPAVSHFKLSGM